MEARAASCTTSTHIKGVSHMKYEEECVTLSTQAGSDSSVHIRHFYRRVPNTYYLKLSQLNLCALSPWPFHFNIHGISLKT